MLPNGWPRPRFRLNSLFILMLGIAIGFALNYRMLQFYMGPAHEARKTSLPTYVIEPPDVLTIEVAGDSPDEPPAITGQHLVGMDGRVNLGAYGTIYVAGMTIAEAQDAIKTAVAGRLDSPQVVIDVAAYNSKVYYVVVQGGSLGDNVTRVPITGNETVLDAIAQIGGVSAPDVTELSVVRPAPNGVGAEQVLPIDWDDIARGASTTTNYQLLPGDRVFVSQKPTPAEKQ